MEDTREYSNSIYVICRCVGCAGGGRGGPARGGWKEGGLYKVEEGGPSKGKMPFLTLAAEGRAERQRRLRNAGARNALLAGRMVMKAAC